METANDRVTKKFLMHNFLKNNVYFRDIITCYCHNLFEVLVTNSEYNLSIFYHVSFYMMTIYKIMVILNVLKSNIRKNSNSKTLVHYKSF